MDASGQKNEAGLHSHGAGAWIEAAASSNSKIIFILKILQICKIFKDLFKNLADLEDLYLKNLADLQDF